MADTSIAITAGAGTAVDTRTESTNGNHRQVVVVGDPVVNDAVSTVVNSAPASDAYGQVVRPLTTTASPIHATGIVASGVADSGNPVKVGGKYNASAPTLTDGNRGDLQMDVNGNVKATLATLIAGEDLTNNVMVVEPKTSMINLTASAQVKGSAGRLAGIFVSSASSVPTIKVWNALTATGTICIDTFTPVSATYYNFNFATCGTGIYVTIGGTVSCTVFYK